MESKRYALSQFETPLDVADLLMCMAIQSPFDYVLDPGCGDGFLLERAAAWLHWLAASPGDLLSGKLMGIERDPVAAEVAQERVPEARIMNSNYLGLNPPDLEVVDAIVGNPPYTRAEQIGHLEDVNVQQLSMFSWEENLKEQEKIPLISHQLSTTLSSRSGLHAYFLVHSSEVLREGGRLAFIMPNGWLDVAYGVELKQFLLDHYRIITIIESAVERWFEEAWVNSCVVVLEKCSNLPRRRGNLVRLARLKKPLHQLLPNSPSSPQRFLSLERLVELLLPGQSTVTDEADVHVKEQRTFQPERKWGMILRAPMVFRHHRDHLNLVPLKMWARVQRGYTTGVNEYFYLSGEDVEKWGIEQKFRQPLLKSLRGIDHLLISADDAQFEVLLVPPDADLQGTAIGRYIRWGEEQGFHLRRTCAGRDPWYSFAIQYPAPIVLPKGVWHRHFAPLVIDKVAVDQQLYQIMVFEYLPIKAIAALMNSVWFALQVELRGRVSFGNGLLWLAAYELEEVQLPDPRLLSPEQVARLEEAFNHLAESLLADSLEELINPARQALDEAVFDILGFSAQERVDAQNSLIERLKSRWQQTP
jgi:SAM-dependent methyltransferase